MSSRKVRVKKLNVKTPLPVLREDQIDPSEYEALAPETQIATGVEQAEEKVSLTPLPDRLISRVRSRGISWHPLKMPRVSLHSGLGASADCMTP